MGFENILNLWRHRPLSCILLLALLTRLVAAFLSQGYINHDDHFLVVEAAWSWVEGDDYNSWLPWNQEHPKPEGHSFFYVGLHYLFLSFLKFLGISGAKDQMLLVRLVHALFSLVVVYLGYRIAERISSQKTARQVGLMLALAWFFPFFSVRNLVEMFCIPFLMVGLWMTMNAEEKEASGKQVFLAGLLIAIAFSVRFQTVIFIGGVGLVLLFRKKWKETFAFGAGVVASVFLIQGLVDLIIWHRPFAELTEYIRFNWLNKHAFGANIWFMYVGLLSGLIIPPLGLFFLWGFLRNWRKHAILFVPTLLFILFHNFFPNKQERFIFPILPFYMILGGIGWNEFVTGSGFWNRHARLLQFSYGFFWMVNLVLLLLFTTAYSKRARCESMYYLSRYKDHVSNVVIEDGNRTGVNMLPAFYFGRVNVMQYLFPKPELAVGEGHGIRQDTSFVRVSKYVRQISSYEFFKHREAKDQPQFILFCDTVNLQHRVLQARNYFPDLRYEATVEPGLVDQLIHRLNPVNKNFPIHIYRTQEHLDH